MGGAASLRRVTGVGFVNKDGYRIVWDSEGKQAPEHRLMIEQFLGRSLAKGETVHHKNGIRTDNQIENLELWRSFHPPGQRITDMVEFATKILEQYGQEYPALLERTEGSSLKDLTSNFR